MSATSITLESGIPQDIGLVTYSIRDAVGKKTTAAVPQGGKVQHPTGTEHAPWTVGYKLASSKNSRVILASGEKTLENPSATVTVSVAMAVEPAEPFSVIEPADPWTTQWTPIVDLPDGHEGVPGEHPLTQKLPYDQQSQQQTQWCWAAVTSSMAAYYEGAADPQYTQCKLANWAFGQDNCCVAGSSAPCNNPYRTHEALSHVNHLDDTLPGSISYEQVIAEICAKRPVCVAIGWDGGGGHAVVLSGYESKGGNERLWVEDPAGVMTGWNELSDFPDGGHWRRTNLTK